MLPTEQRFQKAFAPQNSWISEQIHLTYSFPVNLGTTIVNGMIWLTAPFASRKSGMVYLHVIWAAGSAVEENNFALTVLLPSNTTAKNWREGDWKKKKKLRKGRQNSTNSIL